MHIFLVNKEILRKTKQRTQHLSQGTFASYCQSNLRKIEKIKVQVNKWTKSPFLV
jgi:hypothetical protein